jgi:hypothetical protein
MHHLNRQQATVKAIAYLARLAATSSASSRVE